MIGVLWALGCRDDECTACDSESVCSEPAPTGAVDTLLPGMSIFVECSGGGSGAPAPVAATVDGARVATETFFGGGNAWSVLIDGVAAGTDPIDVSASHCDWTGSALVTREQSGLPVEVPTWYRLERASSVVFSPVANGMETWLRIGPTSATLVLAIAQTCQASEPMNLTLLSDGASFRATLPSIAAHSPSDGSAPVQMESVVLQGTWDATGNLVYWMSANQRISDGYHYYFGAMDGLAELHCGSGCDGAWACPPCEGGGYCSTQLEPRGIGVRDEPSFDCGP